ncbi:hypothetical protein [Synechococcus sp. MU1625]|uniref:hypothetical protein n=1 Tax=Synechococcus sp. MU1625 TaxID=2508347 RepID=UPI001CF87BA6|nr:hypothetical protein [Synechococcus sp. MU1625]
MLRCLQRSCDGLPLIFDLPQALQFRDPGGATSGGRHSKVVELVKAIPNKDIR